MIESFQSIVVILEVEQRKHFLDQMTALGKRKEYHELITNEIADVRIILTPFIFSFLFLFNLESP